MTSEKSPLLKNYDQGNVRYDNSTDINNETVHNSTHIDDSDLEKEVKLKVKPLSETGGWLCCRHVLAVVAFFGFVNVYALRVNLSVALVAMVNSSRDANSGRNNSDDVCPGPGNSGNSSSGTKQGEFDWDESTQGYVLGAFFYGYIFTQLPGGWIASKFGGKKLMGYGVMCTAVLSLLTPLAVRTNVYLFIGLRVLMGIGEGVTFPAMHAIWGQWAPTMERSYLLAFTYSGAQLGTVISLPVSGILCESDILGGWPSVFYIFGGIGVAWCVVWLLVTHDTPTTHPRISREEREYILASRGDATYSSPPWAAIFSSPAVWAITVTHFSSNWGFNTLLTSLPTYMADILRMDMKQNGELSALPYAGMFIMGPLCGGLADSIRRRGILSTISTRKVFNTLGLLLPAVMIVMTGFVGCNHVLAVTCLTLTVGLAGVTAGGFCANHLDLSPKYAGILLGITNTAATIPGFAGPALVGYLTNGNDTRPQWQIVFYVAAGIYVFGALVFLVFGRGEEQPWSRGSEHQSNTSYATTDSKGYVNEITSDR